MSKFLNNSKVSYALCMAWLVMAFLCFVDKAYQSGFLSILLALVHLENAGLRTKLEAKALATNKAG